MCLIRKSAPAEMEAVFLSSIVMSLSSTTMKAMWCYVWELPSMLLSAALDCYLLFYSSVQLSLT